MKSKRAEEYIEENTEYADNIVDLYGWGLFNVVEECDARHAIELAEEELSDKAAQAFCAVHCPKGCPFDNKEDCMMLRKFERKMKDL